jgi:hypothetical protein
LDLTIDVQDGVYLGLENKIGAGEQDLQISDYIDFVRQKRPNYWRFVFLTPSGELPSSIDQATRREHMDSGQLICHSYGTDISGWLRRCAILCSADRVRYFLQDLANWVQDMGTGGQMDLGKANLITELVSKDSDRLDAALSIMENANAVRALLLVPLMEAVKTGLNSQFAEPEWEFAQNDDDRDLIADLKSGGTGRDKGIYTFSAPGEIAPLNSGVSSEHTTNVPRAQKMPRGMSRSGRRVSSADLTVIEYPISWIFGHNVTN